MLKRWRNRSLGRVEKAVVVPIVLLLIVGVGYGVVRLIPDECDAGLSMHEGECVGVTAGPVDGDEEAAELIAAIAEENEQIADEATDPVDGEPPERYLRIALMMPFTSDENSILTTDQIIHALAGAYTAQREANETPGPNYQLLFADIGKDIKHSKHVVPTLAKMADEREFPLVGVIGLPTSRPETQEAIEALSANEIPTIGSVITSKTMKGEFFFKIAPSHESFARALRQALPDDADRGGGFLVEDTRKGDDYVRDLKEVYLAVFPEHALEANSGTFTGSTGEDQGEASLFTPVVREICDRGAKTVFYAGRDRDLPHLIRAFANPKCRNTQGVSILKVGIGMDPRHTDEEIGQALQDTNITLVNAAAVDPGWQTADSEGAPPGFSRFERRYQDEAEAHVPGADALDDGYTVMHHDAFAVLDEAAVRTRTELMDAGAEDARLATEIRPTLANLDAFTNRRGNCADCVSGASGTFAFMTADDIGNWSVCKPVPVIVHPRREAEEAARPYYTHEEDADGACHSLNQ